MSRESCCHCERLRLAAECMNVVDGLKGAADLKSLNADSRPELLPRPDQRTFRGKVRRAVARARKRVGKGLFAGAEAGKSGRA
jgi:hypothetical protein